MGYFLDVIKEKADRDPDQICMVSGNNENTITYEQFWEMSGCVYAYLKNHGIGREDTVCISLPRGYMPVVVMYGVFRCGAAVVMLEDNYPKERTEFIRKDSGCKIFVDDALYTEMLNTESEGGYIAANDHDKAFMIYTSGTTGTPKGVIHEYGTIGQCAKVAASGFGKNPYGQTVVALVAPFTFVAGMLTFVHQFCLGSSVYIVPYSVAKNMNSFKEYLLRNKINATFLSPTMIKLIKDFGPYMKVLFTGSEPVNDIYLEGIELYNFYSMSEGGFAVTCFKVDKPYDVTPIGQPIIDGLQITLVDEDGKEVEDGEIGEVTFPNPYFRGYSNNAELTEKTLVDGIYHAGDLAKKLPDGNYALLGRNNDMIKINGNRVEPGEVESVFKKITGFEWAVAKGFTKNSQSFICLYYLGEDAVDIQEIREKMLDYLPYYMIPAHIIKLDKIPLNANGKFSRAELKAPELTQKEEEYVAPTNEVERILCGAFAEVLKVERVGITDDFYELGGDSLGTMEVISASGLEGINAAEFFKGRTPQKIAQLYKENYTKSDQEDEKKHLEAVLSVPHQLSSEQLYMFDYQMCSAKSTMYNLYSFFKMGEEIDAGRLVEAVKSTIRKHTVLFNMYYFNEECDIVQKYNPEMEIDLRIEEVSERELEKIKKNLVKPFKLIKSPLYRVRIFKTEKGIYLFFDVHHSIFDGTSFKVFMGDLYRSYYEGDDGEKDFYFMVAEKREKAPETDCYKESKKYFEEHYEGIDWAVKPDTDMDSRGSDSDSVLCELDVTTEMLDEIRKVHKFSNNEFFMTASLLAMAEYNKKQDVMLSWIYNDRDSEKVMNVCGLLLRFLPVGLRLGENMTATGLLGSVHEQVLDGIAHSDYPYCVINNNDFGIDDTTCFLYQDDLRENTADESFIADAVEMGNELEAAQTALDIEILKNDTGFQVFLDYNSSIYKKESMEKFADMLNRASMKLYDQVRSNE